MFTHRLPCFTHPQIRKHPTKKSLASPNIRVLFMTSTGMICLGKKKNAADAKTIALWDVTRITDGASRDLFPAAAAKLVRPTARAHTRTYIRARTEARRRGCLCLDRCRHPTARVLPNPTVAANHISAILTFGALPYQDDRCMSIQGSGSDTFLIELSSSKERDLLSSKLKQIASTMHRMPAAIPADRKIEGDPPAPLSITRRARLLP